jgi:hypothetical protein
MRKWSNNTPLWHRAVRSSRRGKFAPAGKLLLILLPSKLTHTLSPIYAFNMNLRAVSSFRCAVLDTEFTRTAKITALHRSQPMRLATLAALTLLPAWAGKGATQTPSTAQSSAPLAEAHADSLSVPTSLSRADTSNAKRVEQFDRAALAWLMRQQPYIGPLVQPDSGSHVLITNHTRAGHAWGRTFAIYILPSGTPAFPIPNNISEKDHVLLVAIVPRESRPQFAVDSCGSNSNALASTGQIGPITRGRRAHTTEQDSTAKFSYVAYPNYVECERLFRYHMALRREDGTVVESAQTPTRVMVHQVYRFTVGISRIFDFGRPVRYSLEDQVSDSGGQSLKVVRRTRDVIGERNMLTVGWHPFGSDPKAWTLWDIVTPTVLVDLPRVDKHFGVGLNLTPLADFGILVGASVNQDERLTVNRRDGEVWDSTGDLPKKSIYTRRGIGFFLGIGVSTDFLTQLFPSNKPAG